MNSHEKDLLAALIVKTEQNATEIKKLDHELKQAFEILQNLSREHNEELNSYHT